MIDILNELPDFCENCPFIELYCNETLGSGKRAYSCKQLNRCKKVYNYALKQNNRQTLKKIKAEIADLETYELVDHTTLCIECDDLCEQSKVISIIDKYMGDKK